MNSRTPQVHHFSSTSEAYTASQCDDAIANGDVLSVPGERVVGILVGAWPCAVTPQRGSFHTLAEGVQWDSVDGEDFTASRQVAGEAIAALDAQVVVKVNLPTSTGGVRTSLTARSYEPVELAKLRGDAAVAIERRGADFSIATGHYSLPATALEPGDILRSGAQVVEVSA